MIGNTCSLARTLHKNKIVVAGLYVVLATVKTTVVKEGLLLLGYLLILLPSCAYVLGSPVSHVFDAHRASNCVVRKASKSLLSPKGLLSPAYLSHILLYK